MKNLFALLLLLLTGCIGSMVPMTRVSGTIAGQPFSLQSPKDSELSGLEITAETNRVTVKIQSLKAKMNPEVISTTADGEAKLITAAAQAGAEIAGKAVSAAAKP